MTAGAMSGGRQNQNSRHAESAGLWSRAQDRVLLLKPRVMSLVVFTGGVGFVVAPGAVEPLTLAITLICMAAGAGACGALNMWYDADIDGLMARTVSRPIPRGRVAAGEALIEGALLAVLSVLALSHYVNLLAGALLALTIAVYVFVYTMGLKRRTAQNIVIGGASGALPPMIGWTAQTGTIEWGGVALFLIIFLWTPPHFWALAMGRANDYAKAGVPMLPVVAGPEATCRQIAFYTALLVPATYLPLIVATQGTVYAAVVSLLNIGLCLRVFQLCRAATAEARTPAAFRLFGFSILYLFAVFVVLLTGAS